MKCEGTMTDRKHGPDPKNPFLSLVYGIVVVALVSVLPICPGKETVGTTGANGSGLNRQGFLESSMRGG